MNTGFNTFVAGALALSLMSAPLIACRSKQSSDSGATTEASQTETTDTETTEQTTVELSSLKTLGDAMAIEAEYCSSTWDERTYVYAFDTGAQVIRASAELTDEQYQQVMELDILDADYNDQLKAVADQIELKTVEDLTSSIPSQEELDKLAGMTGQELLDSGYEYRCLSMYGEESETQAEFDNGLFRYLVVFNESIPADSADEESVVKDLTVKSVAYEFLSDAACDPEFAR